MKERLIVVLPLTDGVTYNFEKTLPFYDNRNELVAHVRDTVKRFNSLELADRFRTQHEDNYVLTDEDGRKIYLLECLSEVFDEDSMEFRPTMEEPKIYTLNEFFAIGANKVDIDEESYF